MPLVFVDEEGEYRADPVRRGSVPGVAAEPLHSLVQPLGDGEADAGNVERRPPPRREAELSGCPSAERFRSSRTYVV